MGLCDKIGAFAVSDFDLVSGANQALSLSDFNSLVDCGADASFKARYHCDTLPNYHSRLFAVNPTMRVASDAALTPDGDQGPVNWGGLFQDQGHPAVARFINNGDLSRYGDREMALLRRIVVFKVERPLFTVDGAEIDPLLEELGLRGKANAYQL